MSVAAEQAPPAAARGRSFRGTTAWGLADQGVLSAANAATLVIVARSTTPAEFGAFVLAYTALLFLGALQTALITQPHNVLGQSRTGAEYGRYTSTTALAQSALSGTAFMVSALAALVAWWAAPAAAPVLLALSLTIVAWQTQEFTRRVLYTERRMRTALAIDVLSYGGQIALLLALAAGDRMSAPVALAAVAASSAVAALVALWKLRGSFARPFERAALAANWAFGKWLGAAAAASWFGAQLFIYLAAIILGTSAAAALKAAQLALGPVNAFLLFLLTILPIRFAAARVQGGEAGLVHAVRRAYVWSAVPTVAYCLLAALVAKPLLETVFGDEYSGYGMTLLILAGYYVIAHATAVLGSALIAQERTRAVFAANAWAAILSLAVGWALLLLWGLNGAAVGFVLTAIVVLASLGWSSRALLRGR